MSDKELAKLFEIADAAIEKAKTMTKKEAISSLKRCRYRDQKR